MKTRQTGAEIKNFLNIIMGKNYISKLGLGTVQFGLEYGISNRTGQTSMQNVGTILERALESSVTMLDTAHLYGNSEEVIGQTMPSGDCLDIVTKTIPIKKEEITAQDVDVVRDGFETSLRRLKTDCVYGLLLHHADDLKSKNAGILYEYLLQLKESGCVKKIGVSVYDNEQIDYISDRFPIDLIQIPMNVFDQRLLRADALKKLKARNVEIHVRSAFLQGVVFMKPGELPAHLHGLRQPLKRFHDLAKQADATPASVALSFLMQQSEVDKVICGVNTPEQFVDLTQNLSALPQIDNTLFSALSVDDVRLINPAYWNN